MTDLKETLGEDGMVIGIDDGAVESVGIMAPYDALRSLIDHGKVVIDFAGQGIAVEMEVTDGQATVDPPQDPGALEDDERLSLTIERIEVEMLAESDETQWVRWRAESPQGAVDMALCVLDDEHETGPGEVRA